MYLLVITIAIGYFCSVAVGKLLDGLAAANFSSPRCQAIAGMISKQRWVWIAPLAIIVAVYVFAIAQTGETVSAPMLYRLF